MDRLTKFIKAGASMLFGIVMITAPLSGEISKDAIYIGVVVFLSAVIAGGW